MATIYDVARAAAVSPATVSRVFNGAKVKAELAARVHAASQELGFSPNRVARRLRRSRGDVLGLIIADIGNPFFTALARGVEDVAKDADLSVVLCNADEDLDKEADYVSVAVAEQMAGVIISPASVTASDLGPLLDRRIPVIAIDRRPEHAAIDTVAADDANGAWRATTHLLEQGYRTIACITGPRDAWTALERVRGYQRALREWPGGKGRSAVRFADFRVDGGYRAMAELLATRNPPDAVLVTNNLMAVGALEALLDNGITPPEMGVVGFGDMFWSRLIKPTLSSVHQPAYELGREAAKLLLRRQADADLPPQEIVLPTELIVRESSLRQGR